MAFNNLPSGAQQSSIKPFTIDIPQPDLDEMQTLVRLSKIAGPSYENTVAGSKYGIGRTWMLEAQKTWSSSYNWRDTETRLNRFPNFKAHIVDDDQMSYDIHFTALFSEKADAIPLMFVHGWPGSFLEFIPIIQLLMDKYSPESLPYHIICPSMPGYAFSSGAPVDKDFKVQDTCRLFDKLMNMIGLGTAYIVQGGDIGSRVARLMGASYDACKAIHVNFLFGTPREGQSTAEISETDQQGLDQGEAFLLTGSAYRAIHATRTSTIGLALQSSPIALLAWIAEKFAAWTDPASTPSVHTILDFVSLYYLTDTISHSLYPYRQSATPGRPRPLIPYITKPMGFSSFHYEISRMPKAWAKLEGDLVFYRYHPFGGHFAALEVPEVMLGDIEEFVARVWK